MSDNNKIRDVADAVKGVVETVPVYQDVLQPGLRQVGKGIEGAVKLALAPLSGLVWGYDRLVEWLPQAIAERLRDVPEERIVTPAPEIAGPTLDSLRFTAQRDELREMYANLLATAMDAETSATAHPAFVEIIRQLTPDEAKLVSLFATGSKFPLIVLQLGSPKGISPVYTFTDICDEAGCEHPRSHQQYLDNLRRLGLIEVPEGLSLGSDEPYERLLSHSFMKDLLAKLDESELGKAPRSFDKQMIRVTAFGTLFAKACAPRTEHA
jgi:hypothetical protein